MADTVANAAPARHPLISKTRPRMAKADLRKPKIDDDEWRARIGKAIDRMRQLRGWTIDELAGAIGRNESQVRAWISGKERPQFDVLFGVKSLRRPLVQALAEMAAGEELEI